MSTGNINSCEFWANKFYKKWTWLRHFQPQMKNMFSIWGFKNLKDLSQNTGWQPIKALQKKKKKSKGKLTSWMIVGGKACSQALCISLCLKKIRRDFKLNCSSPLHLNWEAGQTFQILSCPPSSLNVAKFSEKSPFSVSVQNSNFFFFFI